MSIAYDILNDFIMDAVFSPLNISERKHAKNHIENVGQIIDLKNTIFIMDRGYASQDLIELLSEKACYLFRLRSKFSTEIDALSLGSSLKSIVIPEGVTQIGEAAFLKCSSLQDVSIPHSVTTIGEGAFCRCDSLESITIPDSVNEVPRTIVLSCIHLQHFYYGDAVIDVNDSYYMDETIDRDVHAANEMVHTHKYGIDLPDCIKYPTVLAYRKKQPNDLLTAYICMNAAQIITYLMQKDDVGEISSLLKTEKIIRDYRVMRHSLDLAIQHTQNGGSPEIQMLLMRNTNSHFPAETRRFFL